MEILNDSSQLVFALSIGCLVALLIESSQFALGLRRAATHAGIASIVSFPRLKYIGSPGFFVAPYRFLHESRAFCQGSWFQFGVRNNNILVAFGEEARKTILTNKSFGSSPGYGLLSPAIDKIIPDKGREEASSFGWFFRRVVRTDTIQSYLVRILSDIDRELTTWDRQGVLDPFVSLRKLVFLAIIRITLGDEIATYPDKVDKTIDAFRRIDEASTPDTLLVPWFPTPARVRRLLAGITLYRLFSEAITMRKRSGKTQQDILQTILDDEDKELDNNHAVQLLIMSIFTAGNSSSIVFPWIHAYLDQSPHWKAKVLQEVDAFVLAHSSGSTKSLAEDLMEVPIASWEQNLPTLELCLRETLRLTLINAVPRRNMGLDINLGEHILPKGDFAMYMTADVHMDPSLYPDPLSFDPGRSYDHSSEFTFLGWGAGTHPCTGQRLAKVIIKVTTVFLLSRFTLEGVDKEGKRQTSPPSPKTQLFGIGHPVKPFLFRYAPRKI